jgi:hypothetical protein
VTETAKILCVEPYETVRESRCAILKYSGYDAASASPQAAEIVLRSQKFDLLVISSVSDSDLQRIVGLSDGAEVLVLDLLVMPSEYLSLVTARLSRGGELKVESKAAADFSPTGLSSRRNITF